MSVLILRTGPNICRIQMIRGECICILAAGGSSGVGRLNHHFLESNKDERINRENAVFPTSVRINWFVELALFPLTHQLTDRLACISSGSVGPKFPEKRDQFTHSSHTPIHCFVYSRSDNDLITNSISNQLEVL